MGLKQLTINIPWNGIFTQQWNCTNMSKRWFCLFGNLFFTNWYFYYVLLQGHKCKSTVYWYVIYPFVIPLNRNIRLLFHIVNILKEMHNNNGDFTIWEVDLFRGTLFESGIIFHQNINTFANYICRLSNVPSFS